MLKYKICHFYKKVKLTIDVSSNKDGQLHSNETPI